MKKTALLAIMFAAVLCSCSKDNLQENNSGNEQTITAYVNAATSKLAFTDTEGSGMTSVWEEGDSFYAIQDGAKTVQFTLVSGQGTTSGVFQATTSDVTETTAWVAVLGNAATVSGTTITCAYKGQTGKVADLDNVYYVAASATGLEPAFDFANGTKMSYIIRVKLPAGVKCVEYTPSAYFTIGSDGTPAEVTYNSGEVSDFSAEKTETISLDNASSAGDVVYITVPAIDFSSTRQVKNGKQNYNIVAAIIITLLNDTEANATASNGTLLDINLTEKAGKIATLDLSGISLMSRPTPSQAVFFTNNDASVSYSTNFLQAATVNTYWAPFSIGASSASETGNYYSFGEIIANKSIHSFVSYTLRHKPDSTNNYNDHMAIKADKLVDDDLNKTYYTVAGSRYDVARVVWGTSWRLPHAVEAIGLAVNVVKENGGLKFTDESGHSVSFAATGYYKAVDNSTEGFNDKDEVVIWTADKNNRTQGNMGWNEALYFHANVTDCSFGMDRYQDYCGLTVRPVLVTSTFAPLAPSYVNPEANAPTYEEDM